VRAGPVMDAVNAVCHGKRVRVYVCACLCGYVGMLCEQEAGLPVLDSVYINTMGSYTSTSGSSLVLLSLDGGTWQEVSRSGV